MLADITNTITLGNLITTVVLVVVGIPAAIVALESIRDRRATNKAKADALAEAKKKADRDEEHQQTIQLVGEALFGPDRDKWPVRGGKGQLVPSNGHTVAESVEEMRTTMNAMTTKVDEVYGAVTENRDNIKLLTDVVEAHVSDNHAHGGRR